MSIGFGQILLVLLIIFILFGAGKLPSVMRDLAKGLKSFKEGLDDDGAGRTDKRPMVDANGSDPKNADLGSPDDTKH